MAVQYHADRECIARAGLILRFRADPTDSRDDRRIKPLSTQPKTPHHAPITDAMFDALYPEPVRRLSSVHWTPVDVARRTSELLAPEPGLKILDVGSGAGKLCCVGALSSDGSWHGIEQNLQLVQTANRTARWLRVEDRATFHAGDMSLFDWDGFDSLYFFNPFEVALVGDCDIEPRLRWAMHETVVATVEERLAELAVGTRVVTYHGFGGTMPDSFMLSSMEICEMGPLALWTKMPKHRPPRQMRE